MPRDTQKINPAIPLPIEDVECLTVNKDHKLVSNFGRAALGIVTKSGSAYALHPDAESARKSRKPAIVPVELELPSTETADWEKIGPRVVGYIYNDHLSQRFTKRKDGTPRLPREDGKHITTSPIARIVMENGEQKSVDATELWLAKGDHAVAGRSSVVAAIHKLNDMPLKP